MFIAEKITPKLRALRYLDGDAIEAELKQVIGDVQHAFDITENDVVIFGTSGVLFAGPECIRHETLLLAYLALKSREDFVTNFFNRLFIIAEQMAAQQRLIHVYHEDPTYVNTIRTSLGQINEDCIMLEEVMRNLQSSVEQDAVPPEHMPKTKAGKRLFHILQLPKMESSLRGRIKDCEKQVDATRNEIQFLCEQINTVAQARREQVNLGTKDLYRACAEQVALNDTAAARDVMQLVFAGTLAFGVVDRLTGKWTVGFDDWAKYAITYRLILPASATWLYASLFMWALIGAAAVVYMKYTRDRNKGAIKLMARLDVKVNTANLFAYLHSKGVYSEEIVADRNSTAAMTVFAYVDTNQKLWEKYEPRVVLTVVNPKITQNHPKSPKITQNHVIIIIYHYIINPIYPLIQSLHPKPN